MLKDWTKFEKTLLFLGLTLITITSIIFKSDVLTAICAILCNITVLFQAKGKNLGQVFGIIIAILYSIVSFNNKFYGEVILYILIMLPMYIMGLIS